MGLHLSSLSSLYLSSGMTLPSLAMRSSSFPSWAGARVCPPSCSSWSRVRLLLLELGSAVCLPFFRPWLAQAINNNCPSSLHFSVEQAVDQLILFLHGFKASLAWPPLVERTRILRLMRSPQRRSSTL